MSNELLNYFEETWVGLKKRQNARAKPLFSIKLWNCYDYVIEDLPRTNNAEEAWHNSFLQRIGKHLADIGQTITSLKNEKNLTKVYIEK